MSHLGLGAEFGNIVMMLLLAVVGVRRGPFPDAPLHAVEPGDRERPCSSPAPVRRPKPPTSFPTSGRRIPASPSAQRAEPAPAARRSPPPRRGSGQPSRRLRRAGFERIAKMIFIRLQAANDVGDLNDLRAFTTPEMFAVVKLDLQERGGKAQQTDVVRVDAEVLDVAREAERQVVSVRFHGLIQDDGASAAEAFDEVWHLVKPSDGSREWAIAGIQPTAPTLARAA